MTGRTYRFFHGQPLYPFGFGLSYTSFAYGDLQVSTNSLAAGQKLSVHTRVTNTGDREGDEVAQLYVEQPGGKPVSQRALRGFARVHLNPKESRVVSFELNARDLSSVDADGSRSVNPGLYRIFLGGGQPDTKAAGTHATLTVKGRHPLEP